MNFSTERSSFKLCIHLDFDQSISTLLQQLQDLTALVYLHDQECPVIAFLPESYWCVKHNMTSFFKRTSDFSYQHLNHFPHDTNTTQQHIIQWQTFYSQQDLNQPSHGFTGGYIGFISYDDAAQHFISIHKKSQLSSFIGCYRSFIRYENNRYTFYSDEEHAEQLYQLIDDRLKQTTPDTFLTLQHPFYSRWTKQHYIQAFQRVQSYIQAGDCYQINLTQEFTTTATGSLLAMSDLLWQSTQAPFSGYFKLDSFELLSCSPELFIEWQTATHIKTRPIKGTLPRHIDPIQDQHNKQRLQHSQKDQAENVMIVDLLRNDLSLYAEIGSVKTTKLFEVESFNQVHHLVSEVQATLKSHIHPWQVLMEALPGGSITGAPKIRAMQIIEELEQAPRGAYCGSLGYFNFNYTGRWNILIRTLQKEQQSISLWAGGGITIASQVDAEYQECFDKVGRILELMNQFKHK